MKYKFTRQELHDLVVVSKSVAEVCRRLQIKAVGGNYSTLKRKFIEWDIDTSHFTGRGWNVNLKFKPNPPKPLNELLTEGSNYKSYRLKNRLIDEGLKSYQCERCNNTKWLDNPIPLELHHINGVNNDNRIENLQLLCPNCHALTDNYRGKNKGCLGRNS